MSFFLVALVRLFCPTKGVNIFFIQNIYFTIGCNSVVGNIVYAHLYISDITVQYSYLYNMSDPMLFSENQHWTDNSKTYRKIICRTVSISALVCRNLFQAVVPYNLFPIHFLKQMHKMKNVRFLNTIGKRKTHKSFYVFVLNFGSLLDPSLRP